MDSVSTLLSEINFSAIGIVAILAIIFGLVIFAAVAYRRVVETNMTHIVQRRNSTTEYGQGKEAGNVYYAWPSWVPVLGITVTDLPESNFPINLKDYEAYDKTRLPFMVDVTAFFRIADAAVAAQRVATFKELEHQLNSVLQGAIRRILAINPLEEIMESRSALGVQFTNEVSDQMKEWGVKPVKTIELMDIRDKAGSNVIENVMSKEKSRIDMESRTVVASNKQLAETAEIEAKRTVDLNRISANQQLGMQEAKMTQTVGIAREKSSQEIQSEAKVTAERRMEVAKVEREREADIAKTVQITMALGDKEARILEAQGTFLATQQNANGIEALGTATADAETKKLLAPVTAQLKLAEEIDNKIEYQNYLLKIEQIKAAKEVGIVMAEALAKADLKIISTGSATEGGELVNKATGLLDMFTANGGTKLSGMLAALAATDEGKALVQKVTGVKPA